MPQPEIIDAVGLKGRREGEALHVIDVRLAEDFSAGHVPGALSNCVFEVDFTDRLPDDIRDRAVCVYGASADSHEARMAAEKLIRIGCREVYEFREGYEGWLRAGFDAEGEEGKASPDAASPVDGVHSLDLRHSRLEWLGRNLLNKHWGTIGLRGGELVFKEGRIVSGRVVLDMTDIRCADLYGDPLHDVLITHLQSDDFFDVSRHPKATFEIGSATPIAGATPGSSNLRVVGNLTLRGVTAPIEFDMAAGVTPEGKAAAQAAFSIDRTRWGVVYGSGKFFRRLAGHLVNDEIELQIRMVTE